MKTLSIRSPWWWWILYGGKDIENRSRRTNYRGPTLIQASKRWRYDEIYYCDKWAIDAAKQSDTYPEHLFTPDRFPDMRALSGHVMGIVDIVDVIPPSKAPYSPWHQKTEYGWVLENPRLISTPFAVKGQLGLFEVDYEEAT